MEPMPLDRRTRARLVCLQLVKHSRVLIPEYPLRFRRLRVRSGRELGRDWSPSESGPPMLSDATPKAVALSAKCR